MITKEKTNDFCERAYRIALKHGFHDEPLSVEHMMMLVLSEIGEAVEADRRGLRANLAGYNKCIGLTPVDRFRGYVKDSVEDEMADIAIRLFDLCGMYQIKPVFVYDGMKSEFVKMFKDKSFCERCFFLSAVLCHADGACLYDDGSDECMPRIVGGALTFLWCMADDMGFDFVRHIELKMSYNETRPKKHGKKY